MTIKEIAELCDVDEVTILRWSKKVNCLQNVGSLQNLDSGEGSKNVNLGKNFPSLQNLDGITEESGHGKAADLPVETAAAIIRAGGKEALAFLLEEKSATENALAVQSEAMAKIMEQLKRLPEALERIDKLEVRQEKFEGYAVAAYKRLEARVDGAYAEVRDSAAEKAADHVREYLLTSHKPSAHEAQLAELKKFLSLTITATRDRRDKIDFSAYGAPTRRPDRTRYQKTHLPPM